MTTFVTATPGVGTGYTSARIKTAATTNATSIKASAGVVGGYAFHNNTGTAKYVKLYNKASAPTVGTDVPLVTIIVPANGNTVYPTDSVGTKFTIGIAFAITGAVSDADTTVTAVDDVNGNILYV
jgi:hypothetical protein